MSVKSWQAINRSRLNDMATRETYMNLNVLLKKKILQNGHPLRTENKRSPCSTLPLYLSLFSASSFSCGLSLSLLFFFPFQPLVCFPLVSNAQALCIYNANYHHQLVVQTSIKVVGFFIITYYVSYYICVCSWKKIFC